MNNKGLKDDWRIKASLPIFWILDLLLFIRPIAQYFFNKLATKETIRSVLTNIYCNKEAVDDDLVDIFARPSTDDGALDVFVSILTGLHSAAAHFSHCHLRAGRTQAAERGGED